MTDALKWGILIAVLGVVFAVIFGFIGDINLVSAWNTGLNAIITGADVINPYLIHARKLLNNFFVPQILTVCLSIAFLGKMIQLLFKPIILIQKWIYK